MRDHRRDTIWQRWQTGRMWVGRMVVTFGWLIILASLPLLCAFEGFQQTPETNWQEIYGDIVSFSPLFVTLWGSVLVMMLAVTWGALSRGLALLLTARIISLPIGVLAAWYVWSWTPPHHITMRIVTGPDVRYIFGPSFSLLGAGVLLIAVATWIIPIRRRKSLSPPGGPAPAIGGG
jgi:hypothetical protein